MIILGLKVALENELMTFEDNRETFDTIRTKNLIGSRYQLCSFEHSKQICSTISKPDFIKEDPENNFRDH